LDVFFLNFALWSTRKEKQNELNLVCQKSLILSLSFSPVPVFDVYSTRAQPTHPHLLCVTLWSMVEMTTLFLPFTVRDNRSEL
jgi:hypothetical protein